MRPARVRSQQQGLQRARRVQLVEPLVLDGMYPLLGYCDLDGQRLTVWRCKGRVAAVCVGRSGYRALPSGSSWQPAKHCALCGGAGCADCDGGWAAQGEPVVVQP